MSIWRNIWHETNNSGIVEEINETGVIDEMKALRKREDEKLEEISNLLAEYKENGNNDRMGLSLVCMKTTLVYLEYNIHDSEELTKVDHYDIVIDHKTRETYKLSLDGEPIMAIECIPYKESLEERSRHFGRFYNSLGVQLGMLINGDECWLYSNINNKENMDETPFKRIKLGDVKRLTPLVSYRKDFIKNTNIVEEAIRIKNKSRGLIWRLLGV